MKKLILYIVFFLVAVVGYGQVNLVVNPSFEDTLGCPSAAGEINKAFGWTTFCGSPDYYNVCNTNPFDMSVPQNWAGYQTPASGNAYAGFATYSNSMVNAREFPASALSSSLTIGTKYFISFKVVLALTTNIQANCASDKIGACFTSGTYFCNSLITNAPPVFTNSVVTDSLNWTRISGSFVADSAYTMVVIGNFFNDINTDTTKFFTDFSDNAYYFLDDICVSTDSIFAMNYIYTGIQLSSAPENIRYYPNPVVDVLTIENKSNKTIDLEIYNALGELLLSTNGVSSKVTTVNLEKVSSGILFLKVKTGQQINSFKLIKQSP